jgi:hypothetical protein
MGTRRLLLLVVLGIAAVLPPAFGRTSFLGAAVVDDIAEDDDGLTVLAGVHASLWADEFPFETDLYVYTRWVGEGSHTVSVFITDEATREVVAEAEDQLDFAGGSVTWLAHDFAGTVFPDAGVYTVAVSLDGEVVDESPYYVEADEEAEQTPRLVLSVPASDASGGEDGWCEVSGVFEYFSFEKLPARDTFVIASLYFSGDDGEHTHAVRILDPAGALVAGPVRRAVTFPFAGMQVVTDSFPSLQFRVAGSYAAVVSLDGKDLARFPLVVLQE